MSNLDIFQSLYEINVCIVHKVLRWHYNNCSCCNISWVQDWILRSLDCCTFLEIRGTNHEGIRLYIRDKTILNGLHVKEIFPWSIHCFFKNPFNRTLPNIRAQINRDFVPRKYIFCQSFWTTKKARAIRTL